MDAIDELLSAYERGETTRGEVLSELFLLCGTHALDDVLTALPEQWRRDLVEWIERTAVDDFEALVWVASSGRAEPVTTAAVAECRRWLALRRA